MGFNNTCNNNCIIDDWLFTVEDVDYVLHQHIKSGKAAGIDNLTAEHLFYCHPSITVHFRLVVLKSGLGLESGLKSVFAGLGIGLGLGL